MARPWRLPRTTARWSGISVSLSISPVFIKAGSSSLRLVWADLGRRSGEVVFVSCRGEAGASGETGAWASVAQVDMGLVVTIDQGANAGLVFRWRRLSSFLNPGSRSRRRRRTLTGALPSPVTRMWTGVSRGCGEL